MLMALNLGYDMVIASRFMVGGARRAQSGNIRSLGNRIFNLLAGIMFSEQQSQRKFTFSTFRGIRRSRLKTIATPGRGLTKYFALSLEAAKQGWRIQEIPTTEVARSTRGLVSDSTAHRCFPALFILSCAKWRSRRKSDNSLVMKILLCMLVRNERECLDIMLPKLPRPGAEAGFDAVVAVDGNSTDGTLELLSQWGIETLRQTRRGRGGAYLDVMEKYPADAWLFFSPDGNEDVADFPKFRRPSRTGRRAGDRLAHVQGRGE